MSSLRKIKVFQFIKKLFHELLDGLKGTCNLILIISGQIIELLSDLLGKTIAWVILGVIVLIICGLLFSAAESIMAAISVKALLVVIVILLVLK